MSTLWHKTNNKTALYNYNQLLLLSHI